MKKSISPKKEELEALFLNFQARLDELKISHHEILKVSGPLENQRGGESRVFAAEIARGPVAVRVDFAQVIRDRAAAIILQDYFGRFGATPILLGILEGEELKQLMAGHAEFADIRSPWPEMPKAPPFSAIVMEVVEDGWNIFTAREIS